MLKNVLKKIRKNLGFTMVEALVVVGIIAVTTSIAIPTMVSVNRSTKLTKHNDYAKAIYMASQNNLNHMRASGELGMVLKASEGDNKADAYMPASVSSSGFYYTYSKGDNATSYDLIVPSTLDHAIRSEDVIVEYNPKTGVVYSVFYMEDDDVSKYYTNQEQNRIIRDTSEDSAKERKKLGVGYYSVEQLDGVGTLTEGEFKVVHATSEISFKNDQEARIVIKLPIKDKKQTTITETANYEKGLEVKLIVTGENGGEYTQTFTQADKNVKLPVFGYDNKDHIVVEIPMDSLWNGGSFTQKAENLADDNITNLIAAGDNVTVTADITFYPTAYSDEQKTADPTLKDDPIVMIESATLAAINPMFHSLTRDPKAAANSTNPYILAISNGRHLQNLEHLNSDFIQKIKTIVFTHPDAEEQTSGTTQNGTNQTQTAAVTTGNPVLDWTATSKYYKSGNTVGDGLPRALKPIDFYGLSDNASVNTSIQKLVIDGNNVTIKNLTVTEPGTAGAAGLFGKLANVELQNIRLENPNVVAESSTSTGALAGETHNVVIQNCSVSNNTTVKDPTRISGTMFVGGLVGSAKNGSQLIDCETSANVNGAGGSESYVGGLVGYAVNAAFNDCHAVGAKVESSSHSAGAANKHALGGLVGAVEIKSDGITVNGSTFLQCSTDSNTTVISSQGALSDLGGFVGHAKNAIFGDADRDALQCISKASATGTSNGTQTPPNNNLGGFVGRSESSTYYHPKVYQYTLPHYAQDAGGFAGYLAGDEVYSLTVEFDIPDTENQEPNVTNFGGIASICTRNDSTNKLATVSNAEVLITSEIRNVVEQAAGAFAILENFSNISDVHVVQTARISGANQVAGFAVDASSGARISESSFEGTLVDYATGFVRNNTGGFIEQCYANPTVNNGYAFVRENTGTVKNCFAWAKGANTVAVEEATFSYFGSYDANNKLIQLKFYEGDITKASENIQDTDALADPWAVELLNAPEGTDYWTKGSSDGYPYPMLLKYTTSADSTEPTAVTIPYNMGYPFPEASLYPYALLYVETYTDNSTGELVVQYNSDGTQFTVMNAQATLQNKDIDKVAYYLCHRTDDATFGNAYVNRTSDDFESWMEKFHMSANKLYSIYALTEDSSYMDGTITTEYPLYDDNGAYRIRTADQFARISESNGTFYVEKNFTADTSLSSFSGQLIGVNKPDISVTAPLVTRLSGNIRGIDVIANITGSNTIGAIAGEMTGGSIHDCSVTGSISGGNYVGGVVGSVADGEIKNVTTTAEVTATVEYAGMFVGYASGGSFENCSATGNLPFGRFATTPLSSATHYTTTHPSGDLLYHDFFVDNFHAVTSVPEKVTVSVTNCTINGESALVEGVHYYRVDTEQTLIQPGDSNYAGLVDADAVTYQQLLRLYNEKASSDTQAVKTDWFIIHTAQSSYERLYLRVSSKTVTISDSGTTALQYTFHFTKSDGTTNIRDAINVLESELDEQLKVDFYTVQTSSSLFRTGGSNYLLHCDRGFLAYDDGSLVIRSNYPTNADASAYLWNGDTAGGWSSYLSDDETVVKSTWIFTNDTDSFTSLVKIESGTTTIDATEFSATYVAVHYDHEYVDTGSHVRIPTTP